MATRNTNQGRHLAGSPIAKSGIRPPVSHGKRERLFRGHWREPEDRGDPPA